MSGRRWRALTVPGPPGRGARAVVLRRGRCRVRVDRVEVLWTPVPGGTWQWQLSGTLDTGVGAAVYDVDLFETSAATSPISTRRAGAWSVTSARALRERGARTPARSRPRSLGEAARGWPGERWLDVRRLDVLGPLLERRLDLCRAKGFDGVEADNVDGYANDSGFPLNAADQLRFNRFLAAAAHARGLSIGLKNDLEQVAELEPTSTGR